MRWLKALPVLLGPSCPSQSPCPAVALSHSGMGVSLKMTHGLGGGIPLRRPDGWRLSSDPLRPLC